MFLISYEIIDSKYHKKKEQGVLKILPVLKIFSLDVQGNQTKSLQELTQSFVIFPGVMSNKSKLRSHQIGPCRLSPPARDSYHHQIA